MPYLDGIKKVKVKKPLPKKEIAEVKPKKKFPWKRFAIVAIIFIALVFGAIGATYAYPQAQKSIDLFKELGNGKYLVLLQNNNELRPTGGFIGSFAEVETSGGVVKNIMFDTNIYTRDKAFAATNFIEPPSVLKTFCPDGKWIMRDSNWAVDYPTAAKQVAWFYSQEGGTSDIDGVIAVDSTYFENILNIVGPINLPQYNLTITADNFFDEIQYKIEKEYYNDPRNWSINEPKTILKDLFSAVTAKFNDKSKYLQIVKATYEALNQKHIVIEVNDSKVQNYLLQKNWAGAVNQDFTGDYLYINNANLAATKSSLEVTQEVNLDSQTNGNVVTKNLRIIRTHTGTGDWPSGENNNYTRVLVPKGAKIVSATMDGVDILKDVEVTLEFNKTEFGFWFNLMPQTSKILNIAYEVPYGGGDYELYWQKQPGTLSDKLQVEANGKIIFSRDVNEDTIIK